MTQEKRASEQQDTGAAIPTRDYLLHRCPLCDSERVEYRFVAHGRVIAACADCGHLFANPQTSLPRQFPLLYRPEEFDAFIRARRGQEEPYRWEPEAENGGAHGAVRLDCLDTQRAPADLLLAIHESLKENGDLFLFVPSLDSRNARKRRERWSAFEQERPHFFRFKTLHNLLCKCGFGEIETAAAGDDGLFVHARRTVLSHLVTFIIPVYNEKNTVLDLLNAVWDKDVSQLGLEKELIIVESNSSDGTREIVRRFTEEHPGVRLILEDRPRGKGHAVRQGFQVASGDFITIQDGDLEYDVRDYDNLLLPLVKYQEAFVLGSRHSGTWRMRRFGKGEKVRAFILNMGQILFTALINIGCGTKLKDPFTMFKLFRRECLYGLEFDGNRFEIDWEIVIKLIRKGFIPYEIPVNYHSRGFKDGKKIRMIQDPILCTLCFFRYRFLYRM